MLKIAVINPPNGDGLARTVFDGLLSLNLKKFEDRSVVFKYANKFLYSIDSLEDSFCKDREDFIKFAKGSDVIFLIWGKGCTDFDLAKEIGMWDKTVFIDGSEIGKNGRYDFDIQNQIVKGEYDGNGKIDEEMLDKCRLYFKREKPYKGGIIPLPFGIESAYLKNFSADAKKEIDFFCVFGQDEYPIMRRYSREILERFCKKNGFSCFTKKTERSEFYKNLARAKVGISVGGGGYDTLRFWEILANNCILLTENIDIYESDSKRLVYDRIWQFGSLFDFEAQLEKIGEFLKNGYDQEKMIEEYRKIISEHSSEARVVEIISNCQKIGIVKSSI